MSQSQALVIDDLARHAFFAETRLRECGFVVTTAHSLKLGIEHAYTLLDPSSPPRPTLILIDLILPLERNPTLEGIAGAAHLNEQMELHRLHPAHIVAITSEPTEQREREALAAGCRMLIKKPFSSAHAQLLVRLVYDEQPLLSAPDDLLVLRNALRRQATQTLDFLRDMNRETAETAVTWDVEDVRKLLLRPQSLEEPWNDWIRRRGGIDQVYARLHAVWLPSAAHRSVRDAVMEHGDDWQEHLPMSRSACFRNLQELSKILADLLNSWN